MKIFISTVPFSTGDSKPRDLLEDSSIFYSVNPLGRKLRPEELGELIGDHDVLIAGTEKIDAAVLDNATRLKLIVRVGIGLDSVDLAAARARNIAVSYTPDAPTAAVSELTIGLMLNLMRSIHTSDRELHAGRWERKFGERIGDSTIGVVGAGRIGLRVIGHLLGFNCPRILVNDLDENILLPQSISVERCSFQRVLKQSDLITIHVPLSKTTRNLIAHDEIRSMKNSAYLLNTSRGGIVNESVLSKALEDELIAGAAIDTFEDEPYKGPLQHAERCLLTAHMGSMSKDCRARMEIEATEEAMRFCRGEHLRQPVPEEEYEAQRAI